MPGPLRRQEPFYCVVSKISDTDKFDAVLLVGIPLTTIPNWSPSFTVGGAPGEVAPAPGDTANAVSPVTFPAFCCTATVAVPEPRT